jgi:hypothetical protein
MSCNTLYALYCTRCKSDAAGLAQVKFETSMAELLVFLTFLVTFLWLKATREELSEQPYEASGR